jgi:hypothetical protein
MTNSGHTLTMMHDGVYNTCPSGGYIMQTTTGMATTFSDCSISSANQFLSRSTASCLYNCQFFVPTPSDQNDYD